MNSASDISCLLLVLRLMILLLGGSQLDLNCSHALQGCQSDTDIRTGFLENTFLGSGDPRNALLERDTRGGNCPTLCYNADPWPNQLIATVTVVGGYATSSHLLRFPSLDTLAASLSDGNLCALNAVRMLSDMAGLPVYLVGGPVRDALLGRRVMDLDLSVEGDAVALARALAERLGGECTEHRRFGTATVHVEGTRVDLVTARREAYPAPGSLPEITPGTIQDDLARRDFTINAMALPIRTQEGELIDPHVGLQDLRSGIVRVLHPGSFVDDPTRMFRAVRYEQRFGFRIDGPTLELLTAGASSGIIDSVSGDRWRHEIERTLDEAAPGPVLLRASRLRLLEGIHPALANGQEMQSLFEHPGDLPSGDEWLGALFSHLAKREGEAVVRRLRLSGRRASIARDTIGLREIEQDISSASGKASELFRVLSPYDPVAISLGAKLSAVPVVREALRWYLDELRHVRSSLSGDDLLDIGVPQGLMVGQILASLRDAKLDGEVCDDEEERALARAQLARCRKGL